MTPRFRMPLHGWCLLLLALAWTQAAIWKVIAFEQFQAIIEHHGLLPFNAWVFGVFAALEVVLGLAFALCFAREQRFQRALAVASLLLLALFAVYLSQVPADAIKRVGCGCFGTVPGVRAASSSLTMVVHAGLGLAHAPILLHRVAKGLNGSAGVPIISS